MVKCHDPNAIINRKGMRVLESFLPEEWISESFVYDFGLDYHIEVVDTQLKLLGKTFYIQLKTKNKCTYIDNGSKVSLGIEEKHLSDWAQRTAPIFLCVVDLSQKEAYWLFLTTYLRENTEWKNLKDRESRLQIWISVKNKISEIERFRAEVMQAINYCDSIPFAVAERKKQLESLEPRFYYDVSYSGGVEKIKLFSKSKNTNLKFTIAGENEQFKKIRMGKLGKIKIVESSSPLWNAGEEAIVGIFREEEITAIMEIDYQGNNTPLTLFGFLGRKRIYPEGFQLEIKHPHRIISVKFDSQQTNEDIFNINWEVWKGREITDLPGLNFLSQLVNTQNAKLTVFDNHGQSYFYMDFKDNDFCNHKNFLKVVCALRDISKKINIPIKYDFVYELANNSLKLKQIGFFYELFITGFVKGNATGKEYQFSYSNDINLSEYENAQGDISIFGCYFVNLFGYNIFFRTKMTFSKVESCVVDEIGKNKKLTVKNSEGSVVTHELIKDSISCRPIEKTL